MITQRGIQTREQIAALPAPELLCTLIDEQNIAALLIDIRSSDVLWCSAATAMLDSRLVAGVCLSEAVPELHAELLDPLRAAVADPQLPGTDKQTGILANCTLHAPALNKVMGEPHDRHDSPPIDRTATSSCPDGTGQLDESASRATSVNISIRSVSRFGNLLVLKIEREQDNYYRQYIADREKLFSTSRTLTVNEMATTLAHELNQPIGTVVNLLHGCLERLEQHNAGAAPIPDKQIDNDVLEALDFAIRQSRFASQIIARIREFTEARQPNMEQLDIRDLVHESTQLLDWVLASESVHLSLLSGDKPLMVACDRTLLQQVLVNLCRNAIEAMREMKIGERHLDVKLYLSDDGVHIDIIDSGPGMTDDSINDMFKPFVSSKRDGMGIGLNICRSFVELHQGRLWVTNNKKQGCTAHIRLPGIEPNILSGIVAGET